MSRKLLLGLDIGSSSIKLCQLAETGTGLKLVKFDQCMLPPKAIVDGALIDYRAVVEKLRETARLNKCEGAQCAISMSGHNVIVKQISIPEMTQKELEESMQWEAEQYIPFDIKDVNVDVQILNPKAGYGQMKVLFVVAKKDTINDYIHAVQEAGLRPVVVDIDTLAVQNAFDLNYGCPPNEVVALINVGASCININVISNGITTFTRDISNGGLLMTEETMKQLNVSWEEAMHYQIAGDDTVSDSGTELFREVRKLEERVSEILVTEIQRSLDFFAATTINADIARIYLSGGASQPSAFIRALERRLKIPVEIINPFKNISVDPSAFNPDLLRTMEPIAAVAVGLARRFKGDTRIGGNDVRINLCPSDTKSSRYSLGNPFKLPISVRIPFTKRVLTLS
ncbi:type IV pilus assembly protein PilM [Candidatus Uhrbacteria bacterium]|nr:type IV pilus assembly protein PilM [Candidatus Uhrbacteria bacterium]